MTGGEAMSPTALAVIALLALSQAAPGPLAKRIAHTDPAAYKRGQRVHGGAGELHYTSLLDASALGTNFLFLHRGVIPPKGGIGHHFHNRMEEMFVILDNEAEFTIDGRTSRLLGPAGAPCRMGHSHGIYNPTDRPTQWMNIAVSGVKAKYDAFDLGDDRVGVPLDPKPVFMTLRLDRKLLRPVEAMHRGKGAVFYRRALGPEVFTTNWAYVDHAVLPPGTSLGAHRHAGVEEVYYVLAGEGSARVNDETAAIKEGDAVTVLLNEVHSLENSGDRELEFLIIGVARDKGKLDTGDAP
jgi:mannose-6-phosphate isomerase-like protein (cupin superfamily)